MELITAKQIKQQLVDRKVLDAHKNYGISETQLQELMQKQNVTQLPNFYREIMLELGNSFPGTMFWLGNIIEGKRQALWQLEFDKFPGDLPEDGFVFFCNDQSYLFHFFITKEVSYDTDFFEYLDGSSEFTHHASLTEYVQQMLNRMIARME